MIFRKSDVWDCKESEPCYRFLSHLGGGSQACQNIPGDCFRSRHRPKGWQGVALGSRNDSCYPLFLKMLVYGGKLLGYVRRSLRRSAPRFCSRVAKLRLRFASLRMTRKTKVLESTVYYYPLFFSKISLLFPHFVIHYCKKEHPDER